MFPEYKSWNWGNEYSEWYKNHIKKSYVLNKYIPESFNLNKKMIIHTKINEQDASTGGNFISAPNTKNNPNTIFYIEGISSYIKDKLLELNNTKLIEIKCSFKTKISEKQSFRHIDEIMCFMPYGKGKYKIWFYDEFKDRENAEELNKERLSNLENISLALFDSSFSDNKDNFVFFNFNEKYVPIFNRVWIENKNEECFCLFNQLNKDDKNIYDKEINNISSFITGKKPKIIFVNTPAPNPNRPNGGVHCLLKQQFYL
jgi:hypothetical protein